MSAQRNGHAPIRDRITELRRVPAGTLLPDPRNWRRHPKGQQKALAAMLEDVGYADALLVRETPAGLMLVDGHLRADTTPDMLVPVLVLDVDEEEAGKILATLDPLAGLAITDEEALWTLLQEVSIPDEDLRAELERLAGQDGPPPPLTDPDAVPDVPEVPVTKPGDLWLLGDHRLLCGDAMLAEDVARLLGGDTAAMALTDPPYAIYGSSTGVASDVSDDKMVRPFFEAMFRTLGASVVEFGHIYVHCDWRSWAAVWESAKRAELTPKNCLVWDKGGGGLGNNYANTYEFVGYFARLPREQTMARAKKSSGQRPVHRPNILRFDRVSGDERQHNAAKPVAMLAELIENSSDLGDLVLDIFGGSGSTMMAAEKVGRRAALMEMEPKWCDVIVARWEHITGQKAVLA